MPWQQSETALIAANKEEKVIATRSEVDEVVLEQAELPATADTTNGSDMGAVTEEPETGQKRIDEALEIYQEALDSWNQGEPEKAIDLLDQTYMTISSIDSDENPEIIQQKEDLRLLISKRILEIYAARSQLQLGNSTEIPLAMNDYVALEIKRFQTKERDFFVQAYRRSGKYRPYIVAEMRKANLPEDLSWLPLIESGFKVKALSRARALGLWQFIASTAYRFDLRRDRWVDERMDLERSTQAAITYLKALHDLFGDWTTVLAAYNCGEGNVLRVIRQQHLNYLDNFWDLYSLLPQETARYVPRFLAALHIIRNPEKYGFAYLQIDQPLVYEKVQINKQMRLRDIASALNLPSRVLEDLNPSLRYKATPNYTFSLNVPVDKGVLLVSKLEQIPRWRPPKRTFLVHRVRRGETLSEIARRYRVSMRRIVRANHLRSASRIRAGQRLKIPLRGQVVMASSQVVYKGGSTIHYKVRRGDSLWRIAKRFNTTVDNIKQLNGIESNFLQSGQVLQVKTGNP
ncbi:MAG: LysM peptidoglycan-binding domain-containing protein [Deltaproteobacteria bacterium]|nr:LysM peptidoglycan-binding domain-containing protein [Deltaproteobacteria bacterium]MBW2072578.1 LysM peptidoglycan-binding domain-containing protein [Deltaproteobacteria bacterium]